MKALVPVVALFACIAAAGSAAAHRSAPRPQTLLTTASPITQFAQDGNWLGWTTARRNCGRRLHLLSLHSRRETRIEEPNSSVGCGDGPLAVAGGRAAWASLIGHGNTEADFAVFTASVVAPKPRTVQTMIRLRDDYEPEPPIPIVAGRGSVLAYYRADDGVAEPPVHAVERIVRGRPKHVFGLPDASELAVDRGRIAAVRREVLRGDACNCNFDPVWSPDGSRAAFISGRQCCDDGEDHGDIYVINADGTVSGRARVTSDERPKLGVAWSPDGTKLAFGYYDSHFDLELAVVNADGTGRHDIARGENPSWSPDGTKIAYDDRHSVFIASVDGSNPRRLAAGTEPAWSPNGTWIAFVEGVDNLRVIHPDGTGSVSVASGVAEPAWSPDGTRIAGRGHGGIWIWNAGGGSHYLQGTLRGDGNPSWSPDGSRILFDSLRNDLDGDSYAEPEIYVMNADGSGNVLPVTHGIDDELVAQLDIRSLYGRRLSNVQLGGAPLGLALDGRFAAVLTQPARTGQKHLQIVDARRGEMLTSALVPSSSVGPLSASRGRVVFAAARTIRLVELGSGRAHLLAFTRGRIVGVAISGRRVTWAENVGRSGRIRTLLLPR